MDKDKAAAFIEEKRKEKGLTQQQVAEALHVTRQAVSKWEQGKSLPDVDTLLHLAELFQVPVEALLGEEYTAPPAPEPPWYQNVKKSPSVSFWHPCIGCVWPVFLMGPMAKFCMWRRHCFRSACWASYRI